MTGDFTREEYLSLQDLIYQVSEALSQVVPTERIYILSLGSQQGNSHVHWHIAPLPPNVPLEVQRQDQQEKTDEAMNVRSYVDAERFLNENQVELESNEAANSLMLGICLRMIRHPERVVAPPCLKTVEDEDGLVLAAIMTSPHKLVVYGHRGDLGGGAGVLIDDLVREGWRIPGVLGPGEAAGCVAGRWAEITGQRHQVERHQRVYELREVKHPVPSRGRLRLATAADLELVTRWRTAFHLEIFGEADREEARRASERGIEDETIYVWEDGRPVSIAMKTRPTRNGISVSLVYTPPELRGRGYATACVGELSRFLLRSGWGYCALFVDRANAAAGRVYRKIGYQPTCDYDEYAFLDCEESRGWCL